MSQYFLTFSLIYSSGPPNGKRPQDHRSCINFQTTTDNIGIDWGNTFWEGRAALIALFEGKNCHGNYTEIHSPRAGLDNAKGLPDKCITQEGYAGRFQSAQFYAVDTDGWHV